MSKAILKIRAMRCIKCGTEVPVGDYLFGCPSCLAKSENSSVEPVYRSMERKLRPGRSMTRYADYLPYDANEMPTLGEGGTPSIRLSRLEKKYHLAGLWSKNEFQNPTGSHKDRMNPIIIARAIELGKNTVCCASSGNEAASLAAYASAAGLRAVCVSSKNINEIWRQAIVSTGAELVIVETSADRLPYLQNMINREGWYCATNQLKVPVGSNAFGIQGYKTIAYEICEDFGADLPDVIFIPTCRGDLLYGIYAGFRDWLLEGRISRMPRLAAVEPLPRLERVLQGEAHQSIFEGVSAATPSIGGLTATYQSELALRESRGFAVSVSQAEAEESVSEMAKHGLYLESSSAINFACLKKSIHEGQIKTGERVLMISTSHGYKNLIGGLY